MLGTAFDAFPACHAVAGVILSRLSPIDKFVAVLDERFIAVHMQVIIKSEYRRYLHVIRAGLAITATGAKDGA